MKASYWLNQMSRKQITCLTYVLLSGPAQKIVVRDHGFCQCECEWKKTFEKEADQTVTPGTSFRSAQSNFEAMFTLTDTAKVKLFTAENESSTVL